MMIWWTARIRTTAMVASIGVMTAVMAASATMMVAIARCGGAVRRGGDARPLCVSCSGDDAAPSWKSPAPAGPPRHDVGRLVRSIPIATSSSAREFRAARVSPERQRRCALEDRACKIAEPAASQISDDHEGEDKSQLRARIHRFAVARPIVVIMTSMPAAPPGADDAPCSRSMVVSSHSIMSSVSRASSRSDRSAACADVFCHYSCAFAERMRAAGLPGPIAQHWWPGSASFTHRCLERWTVDVSNQSSTNVRLVARSETPNSGRANLRSDC